MHFSRFAPAAAGLIGLAQATLGLDKVGDVLDKVNDGLGTDTITDKLGLDNLGNHGVDTKSCSPAVFDLGHSWEDHTLFHGYVVNIDTAIVLH